jgi:ERCC4-type nuclease
MVWLDTRETELITLLNNVTVKALPVGDIWVGVKEDGAMAEGGIVIERKSIRDLEASILDGRYREQRGRILAFCEENKTQPMYILEGSLSSSTGRLQKSALMKFIQRLILHYQIPVIQTASIHETAELLQTMMEQWKEDPTRLRQTTERIKMTDGIHVQKKANAADPSQFAIACLAQCSGVSVKMAEALITQFGSLQGVMAAPVKEIEQVKIGARKVGPVVSKRLSEILNYTNTVLSE